MLQHGLETSNLIAFHEASEERNEYEPHKKVEKIDNRAFEYNAPRGYDNIHDARKVLREQSKKQYRDELARQIEEERYKRDLKQKEELEEDLRRLKKLAPSPSSRSTRRTFPSAVDTFDKILRNEKSEEDEEEFIARSRDRNPMDGVEPPPSGKRRSENESEVRSSKINPILDGHPWEPDTLQLGGRRQYNAVQSGSKNPILEPPEERAIGIKKFDTNRGHGNVNPILRGHPWEERSHGLRKFSRGQTNIQGSEERTACGGGKRRLMSSAKSTAYGVIQMALTNTSSSMLPRQRGIVSTYDPIHGTGVHSTLPRRQRLGERIGANW